MAMSEWKECKLGDIVKTNASSLTSTYPHADILYLDTGSITSGKLDSYQNISLNEAPSRAKRLVKDGDIVYSTVRPIQRHYGFIKNPPINLVVSTGFAVIEAIKKQANPLFIYYILSSNDIVEFLDTVAEGSTSAYPSLKPSDIENLDVLLPPLPEQKAIAEVLSSLDDKIDLLHRQNKTLEAMAEALFRQWFVEDAEDGWEDNTPSCLIEKNFGGDWGKEYILPDLTQVCCIRGTDIADVQNSIPSRTPIRFIKKSRLLNNDVKIGDLIVEISGGTESQSTGRAMFVHNLTTNLFPFPIYFSNFCRLIRPAKKECTLFLFHFFRHLYNSDELFSYENGTSGIKNLNYKALLYEEKTKIPPYGLIKKFDTQCMPYWDKILENKIQIRTLEKLRDILLPKLMSGEVRVGR